MRRFVTISVLVALVVISTTRCVTAAATAPAPPPDWRIELMAEAPAVRHPSVVCSAPDGRVFVAEDPMDISAPANAAHGRILCFHADGTRTVFATNLYAVFGMQYLEGKLYVLHNPKFSGFVDDKGVGKDRIDLIESTHPNPWALDWNDHVPANFKLAMDGYFYVAVGDKGVYGAVGRDGKRLDLHGGGIVRLRPDGTGLEIFSTGVRNILDVALNSEDDIFTYDNTDEHNWMGRLTHMAEGGFYGYPYDFVPRRPYTLWMMADFGAGAATGAFAYTEDALPPEYHDNLFLADFGKRQVLRVRIERDGGTYRVTSKNEMFRDPPEEFRPVGIAMSADGASMYICDWAHRDTKENVEVGRLWKMTYTGATRAAAKPSWYVPSASGRKCTAEPEELLKGLSHPAKSVRLAAQRELARRLGVAQDPAIVSGLQASATNTVAPIHARWHALWALQAASDVSPALAQTSTSSAIAAANDSEPSVRRQALRVLAATESVSRVAALRNNLRDTDAAVRSAAATGLGRHGGASDISALLENLDDADLFARYAVFTAVNQVARRSSVPHVWNDVVDKLSSSVPAISAAAGFALRNTYDLRLLGALSSFVRDTTRPLAAREAALRSAIELHYQRPSWKGEWWAYHPALQPAPRKTIAWAGTKLVSELLRHSISSSAASIRMLAFEGVGAAQDEEAFALAVSRFNSEPDAAVRRAIVATAGQFKGDIEFLLKILRDPERQPELTHQAIISLTTVGRMEAARFVADVLGRPGVASRVKVAAIDALGTFKATNFVDRIGGELDGPDPSCRLAAIRALGKIGGQNAGAFLRPLARAESAEVRLETIRALGNLRDTNAVPELLAAWNVPETQQPALEALARMSDVRAVDAYLSGLESANPSVRELCRKALAPIRESALDQVRMRVPHLNSAAVKELRTIYKDDPKSRALFDAAQRAPSPEEYESYALRHNGNPARGERLFFDENGLACGKCHSVGGKGKTVGPDLTSAGKQFGRNTLIEHILYPSRAVREGYAQTIIETRDGETLSGLIQSESAETVSLLDAGGALHSLAKRSIGTRVTSSFSLMPEGLHAGLSLEQFADLISYLESLKGAEQQR